MDFGDDRFLWFAVVLRNSTADPFDNGSYDLDKAIQMCGEMDAVRIDVYNAETKAFICDFPLNKFRRKTRKDKKIKQTKR